MKKGMRQTKRIKNILLFSFQLCACQVKGKRCLFLAKKYIKKILTHGVGEVQRRKKMPALLISTSIRPTTWQKKKDFFFSFFQKEKEKNSLHYKKKLVEKPLEGQAQDIFLRNEFFLLFSIFSEWTFEKGFFFGNRWKSQVTKIDYSVRNLKFIYSLVHSNARFWEEF